MDRGQGRRGGAWSRREDLYWKGLSRFNNAAESLLKNDTVQVPIMLRSEFCILDNLADKDQYDLNECPYDKVSPVLHALPSAVRSLTRRCATGRILRHQRIRESSHRARTNGGESRLCLLEISSFACQLPRRDSVGCREGWKDDQFDADQNDVADF